MISVIHGQDQAKSRLKLREFITGSEQEIIYLDGKKINLPDLIMATETTPIIADKKLIVVENFFQGKAGKDKLDIRDYIFKDGFNHDIIFWENREIDKFKIKTFPKNLKILLFDFPAGLFKFLDSLGTGSIKTNYADFHSLLKGSDPELLFMMIVRQFRLLIMVREETENNLEMPEWQFFKLKVQASTFKMDELIVIYRQLLLIDYKIKSGKTPYKKEQLLDIFFTNLKL